MSGLLSKNVVRGKILLMGQIKKLAVVLMLAVTSMSGAWAETTKNTTAPEVCFPQARFDSQTNTVMLSWALPPEIEGVTQVHIYADFLDGSQVGNVAKAIKTFKHRLERSMVGMTLGYTIKTYSQSEESQGKTISITPTAADVELTGLEEITELWPGQTYKIGVRRNRYAKGKMLLEAVVQSENMESAFSTIMDENQDEFYFTGPNIGGQARFDFWLGTDRQVFVKSIAYKMLSPSEPSVFKITKPDFGQHFSKGQKLEIAWEMAKMPKGGKVRIEIRNLEDGKLITELEPDTSATRIEWLVPKRFRHDKISIVAYYKQLTNYYPNVSEEPLIVCLDNTDNVSPSKPVVSVTADQKRNMLDIDITCFDNGSEGVRELLVLAEGSDGSTRRYNLKPDFPEGESSLSMKLPFYHVKKGVTYTFKAVCSTIGGDSPSSDTQSYKIPSDWSQVYIENLSPGDSLQVGSRFRLNWNVSNVGEYLGANSLKFITPKTTYEMNYFKTVPYSMSLEDVLEGFVENSDVKLWLSIAARTDSKGGYALFFDCIDNLSFVFPPVFEAKVQVATKKVELTWDPYPKADYYVIKKKGYGEKFSRLKTLRGATVFLDDEVTPDSDYWYQIEARNSKDEVIARSDIKVRTPFVKVEPKTESGKRYVSMSWERVSWIEGFNIYRKDGEKWIRLNDHLLSSSDYIDRDLLPGKNFCYKVEGVTNEGRIVAGSSEVCSQTEFEEIEAKIVVDTQTAEIAWSSTTGVETYGIKRLTGNEMVMIVSGILGNRYTEKNLDPDMEYTYQVVGMDKDGNEIARSPKISVRTLKITTIEIQAQALSGSIKLEWQKIDRLSKLELWKDGKFQKKIATNLDAYLDIGLMPKTRYCYELKGFNHNGNLVAAGKACFETTAKTTTVVFTAGSREWTIDSLPQAPMSVAPEIAGGSLYLVTRYLALSVGAGVSWDAKTKTVGVMRKDGYWFNLQVGNPVAVVNGVQTLIGSSTKKIAPYIKNGYTFCPFRFLANNLGAGNDDIIWDATTKTVKITFR